MRLRNTIISYSEKIISHYKIIISRSNDVTQCPPGRCPQYGPQGHKTRQKRYPRPNPRSDEQNRPPDVERQRKHLVCQDRADGKRRTRRQQPRYTTDQNQFNDLGHGKLCAACTERTKYRCFAKARIPRRQQSPPTAPTRHWPRQTQITSAPPR